MPQVFGDRLHRVSIPREVAMRKKEYIHCVPFCAPHPFDIKWEGNTLCGAQQRAFKSPERYWPLVTDAVTFETNKHLYYSIDEAPDTTFYHCKECAESPDLPLSVLAEVGE